MNIENFNEALFEYYKIVGSIGHPALLMFRPSDGEIWASEDTESIRTAFFDNPFSDAVNLGSYVKCGGYDFTYTGVKACIEDNFSDEYEYTFPAYKEYIPPLPFQKYELLPLSTSAPGTDGKEHTLHRIRALKNFGNVKAGDLGGWVESEDNLSQEGDCWVADEAWVYMEAKIYDCAVASGAATIFEHALIKNNAVVSAKSTICGYAQISGRASIQDNAVVKDSARVAGKSCVAGNAHVTNNATVNGGYVGDDAVVSGHASVSGGYAHGGYAHVAGTAVVSGTAIVDRGVCIETGTWTKGLITERMSKQQEQTEEVKAEEEKVQTQEHKAPAKHR